jgi:malate/lactate dehydrogenase
VGARKKRIEEKYAAQLTILSIIKALPGLPWVRHWRTASAVIRNEKSVLSVSTVLQGEYGLKGVCLGVPAIVGQAGVEMVLEAKLSAEEEAALRHSANVLRQALAQLEIGEV